MLKCQIGVPVIGVRRPIAIILEEHDLVVAFDMWVDGMRFRKLPKRLAEFQLCRRCEFLVAEKQEEMFDDCIVNCIEHRLVQLA